MTIKLLQVLICAVSLFSLQGCFSWNTTDRNHPVTQTTTTVHPGSDTVDVTTTH